MYFLLTLQLNLPMIVIRKRM